MADFYYKDARQQAVGPVSLAELKNHRAMGVIQPHTMVCLAGSDSWREAQYFSELFSDLPPPLPSLDFEKERKKWGETARCAWVAPLLMMAIHLFLFENHHFQISIWFRVAIYGALTLLGVG